MQKSTKSYHLIFFFLQPFLTLLYYLKNFKKPQAKNIMWLFTIFYGFTFAIGHENSGSDIVRYMKEVSTLHYLNYNINGIITYYLNSREIDILRTLLAFLVSYFTNNGFYLIIIFSVIYGYFFSRNMWYIMDRLEGKTKQITLVLLFCLFLTIPIWNLNGFRFWTASHVFLYGLLPYLFEKKNTRLIWCFITPFLIHFSFLIVLIPLIIFMLFGHRLKLYYVLFLMSLIVSEINIQRLNTTLEAYLPKKLLDRSQSYRNEEKVEQLREAGRFDQNTVWYARYYHDALKFTIVAFLLTFYWSIRNTAKLNKSILAVFGFVLLFYGFANILSTIPSGFRFIKVANLLALSFLVVYLQNYKFNINLYRLSKLAIPFLFFFIIVSLRESWYSLSLMTIMGNPITALFTFENNISLNDIIKGF